MKKFSTPKANSFFGKSGSGFISIVLLVAVGNINNEGDYITHVYRAPKIQTQM